MLETEMNLLLHKSWQSAKELMPFLYKYLNIMQTPLMAVEVFFFVGVGTSTILLSLGTK